MNQPLRSPLLVGVWPGMGGVAQIAGIHLVKQLGAELVDSLAPEPFFEPQGVAVRGGRILPVELPRSNFYGWRNPRGEQDLLVVLGDQQPAAGGHRYAQALLEVAARHGVTRVFTFAAMATQLELGGEARVFAAATTEELALVLRKDGISMLENGDIAGLNGVFLAAAAERGLPGVCLLGEFPFVAANLPNPRASAVVLSAFAKFAGLELETGELLAEARRVERALAQHMRQLRKAQGAPGSELEAEPTEEADATATDADDGAAPPRPEHGHIEELFALAKQDRSKALQLKAELDRLGLFDEYEDRFLDLFRKAG